MSAEDDIVSFEIMISREAYEKAQKLAKDPHGPAGDLAGVISPEGLIANIVEIYFED